MASTEENGPDDEVRANAGHESASFCFDGCGDDHRINVGVQADINRAEKRRSVGVPEDAFIIVSAGELNKNKNTEVVVRALKDVPGAHYVACGVGPIRTMSIGRKANRLPSVVATAAESAR